MSMLVAKKCACCQRVDCSMNVCGQCKLVAYCSKACQKQHWKQGHKANCREQIGEVRMIVEDQTPGELATISPQFLRTHYNNAGMVPSVVFSNMSLKATGKTAAAFSAANKKMRKKTANSGPDSAYVVWQRAMATSAVVGMEMIDHSPLLAKKALLDFFRLYETFKGLPCTQKQRNIWHVDSYVKAMVYNSFQVDQQLLNAQNEESRKRIANMPDPPSAEKREQVFALVENIELEEATFGPMGQIFLDTNIECAVEVCVQAANMLLNLRCKGEDCVRSSRLMRTQLSLARKMLADTKTKYPARSQHVEQLNQLDFFASFRRFKIRPV